MSDEQPPMPQPTAEHAFLKEDVGRWNVTCSFFMAPDQPPMVSEATEVTEMVGEFWTLSRFECSMMGMPFVGRATCGFEPHTGKFVSTWVDSCSPVMFHMHGVNKGDTLTLIGDAFSCMTNTVMSHRISIKRIGANERLFEMFCTMPGGVEVKMMSNHYRRA